jgi:phosphoribosylformylglycinamidine synthase
MWQFSQVIDGLTKACEELEAPITGGNVSFYNETLGEGIYPTPVVGIVGILEDIQQTMFPHFRETERVVAVLRAGESGDATDAESEFGSSEYAKEVLGAVWGYPPELELEREAALQQAVIEMIKHRLLESAHDCSDGGVAVTLAEAGFSKGIGFRVDLASQGLPREFVLFGEDASRIVVSCDRNHLSRIKEIAVKYAISLDVIGETTPEQIEMKVDGTVVVSANVRELRELYEGALEKALRTEPAPVAAD